MSVLIQEKVELRPLTWWKMGGLADFYAQPASVEDLKEILRWAQKNQKPVTVLGGGSNVLVSDDGVEGLVICMKDLRGVQSQKTPDRLVIEGLAGTPKSDLTKLFLMEKLAPALFLCGLPGDMGGGVVMNAGVSESVVPKEFVEIVDQIHVLKMRGGEVVEEVFSKQQIQWSYRHTQGWQPGIIAKVQVSWPLQPDSTIMTQVKDATKSRLKRQPLEYPSCGSVFKNPEGYKAGALIEQAGLKGYTLGELQVSEKHANFIVNKRSMGRATDARALIEHIQRTVESKFGVRLHAEVQYVGRW